ncbi:nuclear transport factor 2 family protein [Dactylosporangium aurantiacum]|uniref:Nuclear transport factor 2 family protein n=1 Tax=Dactylosporangium aurantiacum TaxID=35754 RepID=A0A9Q9MRA0_9ACTN|nr:nuclear transport factor 2 family protein [Dactylosporangium aurantiacum]MDG6106181.1 nuclear transport factor 2 family protein [Dactylosporangium aurantiacum]UWZ58317.1 nuclear transport factor 2 family protein [Dactylosporangium aurantiacum]
MSVVEALRALEAARLRALVDADAEFLDAVHAPEFVLVNPGGGAWSKDQYVGGVLSGEIDYRRFAAVSEVEVIADATVAVLRYRSAIDMRFQGEDIIPVECWHMDCYRRTAVDAPWQVIWSQATACR